MTTNEIERTTRRTLKLIAERNQMLDLLDRVIWLHADGNGLTEQLAQDIRTCIGRARGEL